jgi:hypothetical protein
LDWRFTAVEIYLNDMMNAVAGALSFAQGQGVARDGCLDGDPAEPR